MAIGAIYAERFGHVKHQGVGHFSLFDASVWIRVRASQRDNALHTDAVIFDKVFAEWIKGQGCVCDVGHPRLALVVFIAEHQW